MNNESEVWLAFKRRKPPYIMHRRIEDYQNAGTWDTWLGYDHKGGWIEFKHTRTKGEKPKQRQGQAAFGHDLHKATVPGFYVIGSSDGHVRVCNSQMIDSEWRNTLILNDKTMSERLVLRVLDWMELLRY